NQNRLFLSSIKFHPLSARKNWLFSNTAKGAKSSATIYSVVVTPKENGLNPFHFASSSMSSSVYVCIGCHFLIYFRLSSLWCSFSTRSHDVLGGVKIKHLHYYILNA